MFLVPASLLWFVFLFCLHCWHGQRDYPFGQTMKVRYCNRYYPNGTSSCFPKCWTRVNILWEDVRHFSKPYISLYTLFNILLSSFYGTPSCFLKCLTVVIYLWDNVWHFSRPCINLFTLLAPIFIFHCRITMAKFYCNL